MRLKQINLHRLQIQLSMPVKHYLAERTCSDSLVVKVVTDSGLTGYGEGVARQYVTGETIESSLILCKIILFPKLMGFSQQIQPIY